MKEVQMTFQVERELLASFNAAAEAEQRPAHLVLCELMRGYILQTREHAGGNAERGLITAAERKRREEAVNFARASVGLEDFKLSKEEEAHARRFIEGEIDLTTFVYPDRSRLTLEQKIERFDPVIHGGEAPEGAKSQGGMTRKDNE
jgi:hypothetical protein